MARFGINVATAELPLGESEESKDDQTALNSLVPTGFETLSKTGVYNPENLYEKINGKAPLYTESGFEKLSTQRYVSTADESLWAELYVYDMGTVKNAFSVYSVQRRAEAEPFGPMRFAYRTANALYLVHGKYYVELVGSTESAELFRAMAEVTRKIRANLTIDPNAGIAELALFPEEDFVAGSVKLYLVNAFGSEGLTDTFTARYKLDDETVAAFLSRRSDPQDAQAVAKGYYEFLINNGATSKQTAKKILEGKVVDFYGTTEIVFDTGPFVAGIHEAENQQAAEKLAERLLNKLREVINSANNE
ncbi:MAG: hypothetical protein JSV99_01200 [Planctomycetota bacterium]|nr:MAG: hypothetical protein JSV99_01200 [Planctomycetota bacterium]